MGRTLRIVLAAIGLILLAGFVALFLFVRDIDPPYQGKRLSVWAKEIVPWQGPNSPQAVVLRSQGSNAAPLVAMMVNARDSAMKAKLSAWLNKQPINKIKFQYQPAAAVQSGGLKAAIVLGPDARSAVPAISQLLRDYPDTVHDGSVALRAAYVLATMGPDGISGLVQALNNRDSQIRVKAAELLGRAPAATTPEVIKALESCARGSDPLLAPEAQRSLAILKKRLAQHLPPSATEWIESAGQPPEHPSVWDTRTGTRVLGNSPLVSGFQPGDMFGTRLGGQGAEKGTTIFSDSFSDGATNWVEWQTPSPVTVRSFGLVGFHQPADQYFERSFRSFTLYAWNETQNGYSQIYSEEVGVPYGHAYFSSMLFLFRNLEPPVTAQKFKAEFVQNGTDPYSGPRVIALYGFTNKLDLTTAATAMRNQDPNTQSEGIKFLTEQARARK